MNNDILGHALQLFHLPFTNPVLVFTLVLLIIVLSPMLMAKIKAPDIVGYIIAGVIIGPYGLNLLSKTAAIELFATIGLLYIMFVAGVDLNFKEFKNNRHKTLIFGLFTFFIPIALGFPVCYYVLHYPFLTSLLTASMFATHTLVAYPVARKYNVTANEAVAITVGGTILTDTAVLIMLPLIVDSKIGGLSLSFGLQLVAALTAFTLVVFLVIPRVAKWFLAKPAASKTSQYVFIIACLFFSAFLAQLAGVEPIIGAFLAGLALNRLIPKPSPLMSNISFVGNAIFIPFFLISIGMVVDLRVLFSGPQAMIVAVTLTIVALAGKWLAALFTQKTFKYSATQRQLVFGLSSSHAAATLAIILIGFKEKIIDAHILNGTVVLILVTCMVASFTTERASKAMNVTSEGKSE